MQAVHFHTYQASCKPQFGTSKYLGSLDFSKVDFPEDANNTNWKFIIKNSPSSGRKIWLRDNNRIDVHSIEGSHEAIFSSLKGQIAAHMSLLRDLVTSNVLSKKNRDSYVGSQTHAEAQIEQATETFLNSIARILVNHPQEPDSSREAFHQAIQALKETT